MKPVRTRIAPSPTGDPHVGTAYVALFNYCLAKKLGGEFILRIEDTDRARSSRASENQIMDALRWLGIDWDEGPDVGGQFGPYRQSERGEIYAKYANELLVNGHAFRCFMTPTELNEARLKHQASGASGLFRSPYAQISPAEADALVAAGRPFVVRMHVPAEGVCTVRDQLRGDIEISWDQVDTQVLLKSDGMPTYHLANVVDDHLMGITHVMRGEEWINSAPKHLLLYSYFGWDAPELIHLPLLRNPDKSKLSKRKNPTSILHYQRMGYLPEAVVNYLGRMAWSMPDESEKFTLDAMLEHFDLKRISLGGPIFDVTKLDWLNGCWIREELSDDDFADRVVQWAMNRDYLKQVIPLVRPRVNVWSDLVGMAGFFLGGKPKLDAALMTFKGLDTETTRRIYTYASWALDAEAEWNAVTIERCLRSLASVMALKLRIFLAPFFVAITGQRSATPLFQTMAILGRDLSRARLRNALDTLGPLSGKEQKKWKKAYDKALSDHAERMQAQQDDEHPSSGRSE